MALQMERIDVSGAKEKKKTAHWEDEADRKRRSRKDKQKRSKRTKKHAEFQMVRI
jgi:hypothetical protein